MKLPPGVWIAGAIVLALALSSGGLVAANYLTAAWMASANAKKWAPVLAAAENQYGIPPGLLARVAYQESDFRQDVIDGTTVSTAGALGILQLEPTYFSSVRRSIPFSDSDTTDQINEGAQELVRLYNVYGDWTTALAAYNDGQGNINKVLSGQRTLPKQTADYLAEVSADLPNIISPTLSA